MMTLAIILVAMGLLWVGYQQRRAQVVDKKRYQKYLLGLNFLLNEESDKAVETFIRMLDVNEHTIETYLSLGHLFRRRGEVDRAIRIHQYLVEKLDHNALRQEEAVIALAQDYLSAGMLDRAETIFLEEMKKGKNHAQLALKSLLDIYQQEKDWDKAIHVAIKLSSFEEGLPVMIAQHYCELALISQRQGFIDRAIQQLKRALAYDAQCARASILQGEIYAERGEYQSAIKYLKQVREQSPQYIEETFQTLALCFDRLSDAPGFIEYLQSCMHDFPNVRFSRMIAQRIRALKGEREAIRFVTQSARQYPSIWSMDLLIEFNLLVAEGQAKNDLLILQGLTQRFLSERPRYVCEHCGMEADVLHWLCPQCKYWSSMKLVSV